MVKHEPTRRQAWARALLHQAVVAPVAVAVAAGAVVAAAPAVLSGDESPSATSVASSEAASPTEADLAVELPARAPDYVQPATSVLGEYADYVQPVAEIPPAALVAYQRAAAVMAQAAPGCHLGWPVLAAIGRIASNHDSSAGEIQPVALVDDGPGWQHEPLRQQRRVTDTDAGRLDGDERYDVPVGPMRFLPVTWAVVAVDSDDDGTRDPRDLDDAALAAAVVLCGDTRDLATSADFREAALMFNSSPRYPVVLARLARHFERDAADWSGSVPVVGMRTFPAATVPAAAMPPTSTPAAPSADATPSWTPSPQEVADAASDDESLDVEPSVRPDPTESVVSPDPTERVDSPDPTDPTETVDSPDPTCSAPPTVAPSPSATETPPAPADEPRDEPSSETSVPVEPAPADPDAERCEQR